MSEDGTVLLARLSRLARRVRIGAVGPGRLPVVPAMRCARLDYANHAARASISDDAGGRLVFALRSYARTRGAICSDRPRASGRNLPARGRLRNRIRSARPTWLNRVSRDASEQTRPSAYARARPGVGALNLQTRRASREGAGERAGALADGPGVCKRARIRELSPHQLRHGFANRFLRESGRDVAALRPLLGHSRIDTTQLYTDEIEVDELAAAFAAASKPGMHKRP